ncbi:MAG: helix-turn-helix domain-containing protein [Desulfarculaceae bacterium]|nr:helix-turn-helix domain-containing protein [Desulfarculaceae bacterium]
MYLINEVSRKVDLSQKRIREYEKEGFIRPQREANTNNRLYSDFEVTQIQRINYLIHERGFTLACLRNLMVLAPCWNIFECPDKSSCAAYEDPRLACWRVRQSRQTLCPGPCEHCAVYLNRDFQAQRVLEPSGNPPVPKEE